MIRDKGPDIGNKMSLEEGDTKLCIKNEVETIFLKTANMIGSINISTHRIFASNLMA